MQDPADAVLDVARQLRGAGFRGEDRASHVALAFSTPHHAEDPAALSAALSDALDGTPFLGWVGASAFHNRMLTELGPGLSVLVLPAQGYVRAVTQENLGSVVAAELAADAPIGQMRLLAAAAEGLDAPNLGASLDEQGVPLVGAICVPGREGATSALAPNLPNPPATALMSLAGCRMLVGVSQAARPLGPTRTVTRAEDNLIYELDGRPALDALMSDLPPTLQSRLPGLAGVLFAGLAPYDDNTFMMRNVIGLDPRAGVVAVAGAPKEGTPLVFAARDPRAAKASWEETLRSLRASLGGHEPLATLVFSCVSRSEGMMGAPLYDVARAMDILGPSPVVGVAGSGEFCTTMGRTHLFSHAAVAAVLLPDPAAPSHRPRVQ